LVPVEVEGSRAWVLAEDTAVPAEQPHGMALLPYFDAYAYAVSAHPFALFYPGRAAIRAKGNFQVLLIEGAVAGVWHQRRSGPTLDITVEPLHPLNAGRRRELEEQAERVGQILEARPRVAIGTVTIGGHA
jgi:hypothetical protein